jgi:hypothetical protein
MKILATIVATEHTFASWVEKELQNLEKKAPTIERIVDTSVSYIGPVLQIALTSLGDAPAASLVDDVVSKTNQDLAVASALITDFGPTPTAASIFASVKTNLGAVLTDANVTNPTTVDAVNKAISEVGALETAVSAAATAISASASVTPNPIGIFATGTPAEPTPVSLAQGSPSLKVPVATGNA